jgi:hypothetical protein
VPQIVSLLPMAPATPAATSATPAAAAAAVPPLDPTAPNFLAQFKAAVKSIARAVVPPELPARPVAETNDGPLMSPVSDELPEAPPLSDQDEHADTNMPELLATLGFALVPPALPPPPPAPTVVTTDSAPRPQPFTQAQKPQSGVSPLAGQAHIEQNVPNSHAVQAVPDTRTGQTVPTAPTRVLPLVSPVVTIPTATAGQVAPVVSPVHTVPTASASQALPQVQPRTAPTPAINSSLPLEHRQAADQAPSPTPAVTPEQHVPAAPDLTPAVMLQPAPVAQQPTLPEPATPSAAPLVGLQPASHGGSQPGSTSHDSGHARHTPEKIASISSEVSTVQTVPASDATMAAAAATTAPVSAAPVAVQVTPSQVVSQIARHADLIRLPGNRGLRIQLNPDDLGGVQVTVRYSAAGGVELHINAEHAATAALVQAGWSELRDALATQGISPDRLMMSVTAPTSSDLSGGGNSRSDSNAFGSSQANQDGQSQSRQNNAQQRTSQSWSGSAEPVPSPDASSRVASATSAPTRIDYRV